MAQSQNTKVDYTVRGTSFQWVANYGSIMIGDKAFEFYNQRNVEDYIQIPWGEIDYVSAAVLFGNKIIPRFVIFTKKNGRFTFSCKDNKRLLREMRAHLSDRQLQRSPSFFTVIHAGLQSLSSTITRIFRRNK